MPRRNFSCCFFAFAEEKLLEPDSLGRPNRDAFCINVTKVISASGERKVAEPIIAIAGGRLSLLWRIAFSKYLNDDFSAKRLVAPPPVRAADRFGLF